MRNLILCLALGAAASSAFALTNEDLAANTWMPLEEQTESSCELPAMIDFHKDGTLSSEPGCNTMSGRYKIGEDGKIEFTEMAMTQRMCAKEYMDQEMRFTTLINATHFIKKEDKQLIRMFLHKVDNSLIQRSCRTLTHADTYQNTFFHHFNRAVEKFC